MASSFGVMSLTASSTKMESPLLQEAPQQRLTAGLYGISCQAAWHGHLGRVSFTGWKPVPQNSVKSLDGRCHEMISWRR